MQLPEITLQVRYSEYISNESCSADKLLTTLPATDASGFAMSDEFAYTQDTYYLKEIGTPKWYHPSTAAIPFSVEHRKVLDEDGNDTGKEELPCIASVDHQ